MTQDYISLDFSEKDIFLGELENGDPIKVKIAHSPHNPTFFLGGATNLFTEESRIVKHLLTSLKTKYQKTKIVVPFAYTYAQVVEMPLLKEKELALAIEYKADEIIPLPLSEVVLAIETLYVDMQKQIQYVLVVAAQKNFIEKIQSVVEMSGLFPVGLETQVSAFGKFLQSTQQATKTDEYTIYVWMGTKSTSLYLYNTRLKIFTQLYSFDIGTDLFVKDLSMNLALPTEKSYELLIQYGFQKNEVYNSDLVLGTVKEDFIKNIQRFIVSAEQKLGNKKPNICFIKTIQEIPEFFNIINSVLPATLFDTTDTIQINSNSKINQALTINAVGALL